MTIKKIVGTFIALIGLIALSPTNLLAHIAGDQSSQPPTESTTGQELVHDTIQAMIVEPDLFQTKTRLPIWVEVKDTKTNAKLTDLELTIEIINPQGKLVSSGKATLKGDVYLYEYTFPQPGDYKYQVKFIHEGQPHQSVFTIPVSASKSQAGQTSSGLVVGLTIGGAAVGIGLIWLYSLTRKKKNLKVATIATVVIIVIAGLAYAVAITFLSGAVKSGVVTCLNDGRCYWTAHIHAYFPISVCGEDYKLPIEKGPLDGPHTHEEKNIAHWHGRLAYDRQTNQITEIEPLKVSTFFEKLAIPLTNQSIAQKKNGDLCPSGKPGTLKSFVNGKNVLDIANHLWQDREVIQLIFDERDPSAIEQELKSQPIQFPALGRG